MIPTLFPRFKAAGVEEEPPGRGARRARGVLRDGKRKGSKFLRNDVFTVFWYSIICFMGVVWATNVWFVTFYE